MIRFRGRHTAATSRGKDLVKRALLFYCPEPPDDNDNSSHDSIEVQNGSDGKLGYKFIFCKNVLQSSLNSFLIK